MNDLPLKSISVGGQRFRIRFAYLGGDYGHMIFDDRVILISESLRGNEKQLFLTITHELFHAALHVAGVSFSKRQDEEALVRALEHLFLPAFFRLIRAFGGIPGVFSA